MVLVGDRGAEERHDAATGVLVDGPRVAVNAGRKNLKQAIEQAMPFFGIDALRDLHRAHDVGEEDFDQLALARSALWAARIFSARCRGVEVSARHGGVRGGAGQRTRQRAQLQAAVHLSFWPKNAGDAAYVSWHQDATYFGLEPPMQVTAWRRAHRRIGLGLSYIPTSVR